MKARRFRETAVLVAAFLGFAAGALPAASQDEIIVSAAVSLKNAFGEIGSLYARSSMPRTAPVARAVGAENIFVGRILGHHPEDGLTSIELGSCRVGAAYSGLPPGSRVTIGIRSEDILVSRERITQTSARNVLKGAVRRVIREMDKAELIVNSGVDFKVSVTPATVRILELGPGSPVYLLIKARALHLLA